MMERRTRAERPIASPWLRVLCVTLLGAVLAVIVWHPMFEVYPNTPEGDGRYFLHLFNVVKVSLLRYHEIPLWNPFECGGAPLWDNPESMAASPILWLAAPLSGTKTLYVWNIVHLTIGFVGMWLLARDELSLSRIAAFTAACIYAFGMCHASQYAGAHSALISFLDAPLALYFWRGAERDSRKAVALGLVVALMFFDGATYPIPHTALLLGAETLTRLGSLRRVLNIVKAAAITGATAFVTGAARILPLVDQFRSKHREIAQDADYLRWGTLKAMYMSREIHWYVHMPGQTYVWGEYGAYMGGIVLTMCAIGLVLSGKRYLWLVALGLFVFLLMLGHFSDLAPWHLLNTNVFPFKSMRVSARFRLILCMFIAAFVGIAIDRAPAFVARMTGRKNLARIARVLAVGFALVGAGDMMGVASDLVSIRFAGPPEQKHAPAPRLYYEGKDLAEYVDQPGQNRGRIGCQDAWAFSAGAPVWAGDLPQARAKDKTAAVVEVANRTQNTFTIDVVAKSPTRILVNSGFERGWQSDVGTVGEEAKLLVVDVPEGRHHIHLEYVPKGFYVGVVLTFLGIIFSIVVIARNPFKTSVFSRSRKTPQIASSSPGKVGS